MVLLGGPNGAGKTTASRQLLQGALQVTEFALDGSDPGLRLVARGARTVVQQVAEPPKWDMIERHA